MCQGVVQTFKAASLPFFPFSSTSEEGLLFTEIAARVPIPMAPLKTSVLLAEEVITPTLQIPAQSSPAGGGWVVPVYNSPMGEQVQWLRSSQGAAQLFQLIGELGSR